MRIAEHDTGAHADELIGEVEARLEHFFVHEDHAFTLGRRDDRDGHDIGRERGPRLILKLRHMSAEVTLDDARLLGGNDEIVAVDQTGDAKAFEPHERAA